MKSKKVAVVGAGLGGLTAACTLAARGHDVELFDKNDWIGGKAAELCRDGFRFDMGPTILTIPQVLFRVFQEAGRKVEDYIDLVRLDPQWRCFFDDGSVLDLCEDVEKMAQSIGEFTGNRDEAQGYRDFIAFRSACTSFQKSSSSGRALKISKTCSTLNRALTCQC